MLSYPFHSSDKSSNLVSVAFTKLSSSPCAVIFHNRASLYSFGADFIVCCASLESPVASDVEYSVQVVTHFHNACGVLIIAFVTFGATTSAHRASALLPFVASVQAHFTICGANRSDGSSVTSFCAHSISLVPAIAVPITPPPHF